MLKIWPQVKVMTRSEKVMLHIGRSASSAWAHLWCFQCSSLSLLNVIAEKLLVTFHDLKQPRGHEKESLAIFRFRVSILPVTRCFRVFRIVFAQKRRLSNFSLWLMERSQTLPDLGSPISNLQDHHFIDTVTDINFWRFQSDQWLGVAMTGVQSFMRWGHLMWPDDLTLSDLELKFSHWSEQSIAILIFAIRRSSEAFLTRSIL